MFRYFKDFNCIDILLIFDNHSYLYLNNINLHIAQISRNIFYVVRTFRGHSDRTVWIYKCNNIEKPLQILNCIYLPVVNTVPFVVFTRVCIWCGTGVDVMVCPPFEYTRDSDLINLAGRSSCRCWVTGAKVTTFGDCTLKFTFCGIVYCELNTVGFVEATILCGLFCGTDVMSCWI